jgi:hypothetical protein
MKEGGIGGACNIHWEMRSACNILVINVKQSLLLGVNEMTVF